MKGRKDRMKWNRLSITTIEEAEDMIISEMEEIGLEGAEILDKKPLTEEEKQQMFVDILPEGEPDDGTAVLNFYLEEDVELEKVRTAVEEKLEWLRSFMDIGEGTVTFSQTEDQDWINNWKQYFHQFAVDDILIVPSWEEVKDEDKDKLILHIDPGTAFGTGMHETTQLVIRQIVKYLQPGWEILDAGTGSGILGIVALKKGAGDVMATDLDPCTVSAVKDNLESNGIPSGSFELKIGNLIDDKETQDWAGYEKFDLVTANILAKVLVVMTPEIVRHMKKGAIYITSGIQDVQEKEVTDAIQDAGLTLLEITRQGEWISVTARKD